MLYIFKKTLAYYIKIYYELKVKLNKYYANIFFFQISKNNLGPFV